ncbi:MAG: exo-alpha-sialidase, partial [Methanobacteriota archaeon]
MEKRREVRIISRFFQAITVFLILLPNVVGSVSDTGNAQFGVVEWEVAKSPGFPDPISASWSDVSIVSDPAYLAEHPDVATSSRNVHVVWQDQRSGKWGIRHRRSIDNGVNFEPEETLTPGDTDYVEPAIAVNGKIAHVVYQKDVGLGTEIWYTRNQYDGSGWFQKIRISQEVTEPYLISVQPAIAVSGSYVHVVWTSNADGLHSDIYCRSSSTNGGSWGPIVRITQSSLTSNYPKIAAGGPNLHVVWKDGTTSPYQVYYRMSPDYGETWNDGKGLDADRVLSHSATGTRPSVAVVTRSVYVVWRGAGASNSEVFGVRSTDNGYSWIEERLLSDDVGASSNPALAANGNNVHVLWPDNRNGKLEIFYKRSTNDFRTFGTDTKIAADITFDLTSPALSVFDNNIHVVGVEETGFSQIWYKNKILDDETWNQFDVSVTTSRTASLPSVASSSNYVHVLWQDNRDPSEKYEIYYRRSANYGANWDDGNGNPFVDRLIYGTSDQSVMPKIVASGRYLYAVWATWDSGIARIYFCRSTDNGEQWTSCQHISEPVETSDNFLSPSIAVSRDTIHVVWTDVRSGNNEIFYRRSTDRGLTWNDGTGNDQDRMLSSYPSTHSAVAPSIAVDGYNVHVVWQDNRDGNNEIYYRRSKDEGETWDDGNGEDVDRRLTVDSGDSILPSLEVFHKNVHVAWCDHRDPTWGYDVYYKRSTGEGSEWDPDLRINDVSIMSYPPVESCKSQSVAWAPLDLDVAGNNIYITWQDLYPNDKTNIVSRRSANDGETWDLETTRYQGIGDEPEMPAIHVDDVNVFLVWTFQGQSGSSASVQLSRKILDDNSWMENEITNVEWGLMSNTAVATNLNNIHLVWLMDDDPNDRILYRRSTDFGETWDSEQTLYYDGATNPHGPDIAVSGNFVHVVFHIEVNDLWRDRIVYMRSDNNGVDWSDYLFLDDVDPEENFDYRKWPSIAVSGNCVHVVWQDRRDGLSHEIYYRQSCDNGESWNDGTAEPGNDTDRRLTYDAALSILPQVATNGNNIHVMWEDRRSDNPEIYYKRSVNNGETWGNDRRLTDSDGGSTHPNVAVVGETVHLTWCDRRMIDTEWDIFYKKSSNGGMDWTEDYRVNEDVPTEMAKSCYDIFHGIADDPGIAANGNNMYLAWNDAHSLVAEERLYSKKSGQEGDIWG